MRMKLFAFGFIFFTFVCIQFGSLFKFRMKTKNVCRRPMGHWPLAYYFAIVIIIIKQNKKNK